MITKKQLHGRYELNQFIAMQKLCGGAEVSSDYLSQAQVFIFFRVGSPDTWVAGYVVSTARKRYLDVFNPDQREIIEREHLPQQETVEITCIWRNSNLDEKLSKVEMDQVYASSLEDALSTERTKTIGGTTQELVRRIQMSLFKHLAFSGDVTIDGHTKHAWVYYATASEIEVKLEKMYQYL